MFSKSDLEYLKQSPYDIIQQNNHDMTIHSRTTDHEWTIVSNYEPRIVISCTGIPGDMLFTDRGGVTRN